MALFAELNENNIVTKVIVVDNNDVINNGGNKSQQAADYIKNKFGTNQNYKWIQSSDDKSFRLNIATVGGDYLENEDIFRPAKYFPSWVWNSEILDWQSPIGAKPTAPETSMFVKWTESEGTWYAYVIIQQQDIVVENGIVVKVNIPEIFQWHKWNNIDKTWSPEGQPITVVY
jgi:hypothetical protein